MIFNSPSFDPAITNWYIFLCGIICSLAMILPGISGAYILIILGTYEFLIKKISDFSAQLDPINTIFIIITTIETSTSVTLTKNINK